MAAVSSEMSSAASVVWKLVVKGLRRCETHRFDSLPPRSIDQLHQFVYDVCPQTSIVKLTGGDSSHRCELSNNEEVEELFQANNKFPHVTALVVQQSSPREVDSETSDISESWIHVQASGEKGKFDFHGSHGAFDADKNKEHSSMLRNESSGSMAKYSFSHCAPSGNSLLKDLMGPNDARFDASPSPCSSLKDCASLSLVGTGLSGGFHNLASIAEVENFAFLSFCPNQQLGGLNDDDAFNGSTIIPLKSPMVLGPQWSVFSPADSRPYSTAPFPGGQHILQIADSVESESLSDDSETVVFENGGEECQDIVKRDVVFTFFNEKKDKRISVSAAKFAEHLRFFYELGTLSDYKYLFPATSIKFVQKQAKKMNIPFERKDHKNTPMQCAVAKGVTRAAVTVGTGVAIRIGASQLVKRYVSRGATTVAVNGLAATAGGVGLQVAAVLASPVVMGMVVTGGFIWGVLVGMKEHRRVTELQAREDNCARFEYTSDGNTCFLEYNDVTDATQPSTPTMAEEGSAHGASCCMSEE